MENEAEENITSQKEELEALEAIYNDDFTLEYEDPPTFSIGIKVGSKEDEECVLSVSFPPEYPKSAPPIYQLSIPWLRGQEKENISLTLGELYLNHIGDNIVYLWVESLREVLLENKPDSKVHDSLAKLVIPDEDNISHTETEAEFLPEKKRNFDHNLTSCQNIEITTGMPLTDRKSTFQAHVATVTELQQTKFVLSELYKNKKIATATHNMYAYRICKEGSQNVVQDCEDDGETHAGSRLLHLLQILDCKNVIIVVTRWYGGIQLHGDRFKHINNVARQLLSSKGYISKEKVSGPHKR